MYKVLEVTGIIGAIYADGKQNITISINEIKSIMSKVNEKDPFISTRLSRRGLIRVLELADLKEFHNIKEISIPQGDLTQSRFIREYYKLDYATRTIISEIIKEFNNGRI